MKQTISKKVSLLLMLLLVLTPMLSITSSARTSHLPFDLISVDHDGSHTYGDPIGFTIPAGTRLTFGISSHVSVGTPYFTVIIYRKNLKGTFDPYGTPYQFFNVTDNSEQTITIDNLVDSCYKIHVTNNSLSTADFDAYLKYELP